MQCSSWKVPCLSNTTSFTRHTNDKESLNDADDDMESVLKENRDQESESVEEQEIDDVQQKQM